MNALDDIRIRSGADDVTEEEGASVLAWLRDWIEDVEPHRGVMDTPSLLRVCDRLIDGGIAFVLADVRRVAAEDRGERGYRHPDADAGPMAPAKTISVVFDLERYDTPHPIGSYIRTDEDVVIYDAGADGVRSAPVDCVAIVDVTIPEGR